MTVTRRKMIVGIGCLIGSALSEVRKCLGASPCWWNGHHVDMPVSLAKGTVRTKEFTVCTSRRSYFIVIRAEKRPSIPDLHCKLGLNPPYSKDCDDNLPLLQADWTLWSEGQIVAHGGVHGRTEAGGWGSDILDRYLGHFRAEPGKKYVVEVTFTTDGSALDVTNPHLLVTLEG